MRSLPLVAGCGVALAAAVAAATLIHSATGNPTSSTARSAAVGASTAATAPRPPASSLARPAHTVAWRIHGAAEQGIEGYADTTSATPGQPVRLYVSTQRRRYRVQALRMGWYPGGSAELVWSSPWQRGSAQPGPSLLAQATHTWTARWQASLTLHTAGWSPGDYLIRLDAGPHHRAFVPLTVRGPSARNRIVLVSPVTTWQAYNLWGCCDLYQGGDGSFATRSRAVSFDRPYLEQHGAGQFITRELPVVVEAERLRLPLDYVTDIDLAADPGVLAGAAAVVSMGHDEYWSPAMRATLTAARGDGTNIAFLGANGIFRRIRLAPTALGPDRLEINYKIASEDPLNGRDNAQVTADWPAPPDPQPESALLGDQYGCFPGRVRVAGVVVAPQSWLFAGAHVTAGERLPGLVGPETDAVQLSYPTPRPLQIVLHSPTQCPGDVPPYADASYYVARSGAGVFDAGTIDWVCALGGGCYARGPTTRVVRTVTDNLLRAFAQPRAGARQPAQDNLKQVGVPGA